MRRKQRERNIKANKIIGFLEIQVASRGMIHEIFRSVALHLGVALNRNTPANNMERLE